MIDVRGGRPVSEPDARGLWVFTAGAGYRGNEVGDAVYGDDGEGGDDTIDRI